MIPFIPEEIRGKIKFIHEDVRVKDGVELNEEEKQIFDKFRPISEKVWRNQEWMMIKV